MLVNKLIQIPAISLLFRGVGGVAGGIENKANSARLG